jgi:putative DNA primase/helicase
MNKFKHDPIDLGLLFNMLAYIPADIPREDWARYLMAAKSEFGEEARGAMSEWSATASNYDSNAFNSTWKSIKAGGGVTIATLVHEAKENGFNFAPMTSAEKQRLRSEQRKRDGQRMKQETVELEKREWGYIDAKQKAQNLLKERAFYANSEHPYFVNKGISEDLSGLCSIYQCSRTLIVPVYRFKALPRSVIDVYEHSKLFELMSLQFIGDQGGKRFLKGGQTKGGFFPIRFRGYVVSIVICEGFATGVTYAQHYDTVSEVVCAFNARNLKHVARAFKVRYPMARIIIAGDNDRQTEKNTGVNVGLVKAREAAKLVDGLVCTPEFNVYESGTDWNDRYVLDQFAINEPNHTQNAWRGRV